MRFTLANRAYLLLAGILFSVIVMGVSLNQISKVTKVAKYTGSPFANCDREY